MKVYILERDSEVLQSIISLLKQIPYLRSIGYTADSCIAERDIPMLHPNLILSDRPLQTNDSLCFVQQGERDFIYITTYVQQSTDELNVSSFAYLQKPIDNLVFRQTIENCYRTVKEQHFQLQQMELTLNYLNQTKHVKKIALRNSDYIQIVSVDEIIFCRSDKGYTTFYLDDGSSMMTSKVLKEYESLLPSDLFFRCHQSYLVNLQYIHRYYKEGLLKMKDKHEIPVSDRKRQELLDYLQKI